MGLIDRAKGVVNSFMNSHDQIDRAKAEDVVEKLKKEHNESVKHRKNNLENEYKSNKLAIVKDVAHKALSDFLYPKFLEGNVGSRSIHSFLKDLAALPQHIKDKDGNDINITKIQDAFNNALDIQLNMEEIQVRKETTKFEQAQKTVLTHSLANEIALDIQKLPVGETMMMPGGTRTHAMLYEFTRTSSDKLTLKVHNPGDGIINHVKNPSSIKWSGPIKAGSLTIKDIDQNAINAGFIKELINPVVYKEKTEVKSTSTKIQSFIKSIFSKKIPVDKAIDQIYRNIDQKLVEAGRGEKIFEEDPSKLHTEQKIGICSRKVLSFWVKENFDPVGHLQFKVTSSEVAIKHLKELVITDLTVKKPSLFRRVWNYLNNKITKQEIHSLAQDKLEQRKDKLNKALMERGILIDLDNQASEASRPVSMQSKR